MFSADTRMRSTAAALVVGVCLGGLDACKRSEPPPDPLKTQRDAMERAKKVGDTMQQGVDREGGKIDEEGK